LREDNYAVMASPGGPYGKRQTLEMCVKKAEKASRLFYFEKKEVRFFKKKRDNTTFSIHCHQKASALPYYYRTDEVSEPAEYPD